MRSQGAGNQRAHFIKAPFLFCLQCGVSYGARQTSDYGKLATLGSEGRSTATTILSLSTVRSIRQSSALSSEARKLLSFTDNRQDASLQAGHFNDFLQIGLLRSALLKAVRKAGADGLRHDTLALRVFEALDLPLDVYAVNPEVEYLQLEGTQRTLRQVLGYHLYHDLRRGWRVTSPNLEQTGLLVIGYLSLEQICADVPKWAARRPALARATADQRRSICTTLLDYLRRELAIRVDFLEPRFQEGIQQVSKQYLVPPWALDEEDRMEHGAVAFPGSRGTVGGGLTSIHVSARGGFGQFLRQPGILPAQNPPPDLDEIDLIIDDLFQVLASAGLLHRFEPRSKADPASYQLNASALVWQAGSGETGVRDPVRVRKAPKHGHRTNPFFKSFYQSEMDDLKDLEAREHTAQVPNDIRQQREDAFREARLPVLFCSPTMELGVDIRLLNVVSMRNIPPTPANYAQRSGRAGRSGQPAFIFSYCSAGSPHDQYFFKRPERMVAGAVATPRLDLANEDLLRAHVQAVWLQVAGLDLGQSLRDVLDVQGTEPTLQVKPDIRAKLEDPTLRRVARNHARLALGSAISSLLPPDMSNEQWIDQVLDQLPQSFESACERWRGLYRAAFGQSIRQSKIILDASRSSEDRERAKRLREEAEAQLRLLVETENVIQSDFYSYRYFASEGFLPGYNFPRLPLSAYLPGRRRTKDDFLSRPRFLAIQEFGPRSIIYHEGSRYVTNKVLIPVDAAEQTVTRRGAQCHECGYLHPLGDEPAPDLCEHCRANLGAPLENLFRMQNVVARRCDRINSDEEERIRLGYELKTGIRFADADGAKRKARLLGRSGTPLATLLYGHSATLWRINLGWRQRRRDEQAGFVLDLERGFWEKTDAVADDPDDPLSPRTQRVIPYVEDRRNCLLVTPAEQSAPAVLASLQAALKAAIQVEFQLEDNELAAEPLPGPADRRLILLYEAAEGGAGVLRRLIEEPVAFSRAVRTALELCHFDPATGQDRGHAVNAREDCEAACYDCLLSYYNQRDHPLLDRKLLAPLLLDWADGRVQADASPPTRTDRFAELLAQARTDVQRQWLHAVHDASLRLPSRACVEIKECAASVDFVYNDDAAVILLEDPGATAPPLSAPDPDSLSDLGYTVIRFGTPETWPAVFGQFPHLFGAAESPRVLPAPPPHEPVDLELYDPRWHPLITSLGSDPDLTVEPGGDVVGAQGRVVGTYLAKVSHADRTVILIDADDSAADAVEAALSQQNQTVHRVRPGDTGLS